MIREIIEAVKEPFSKDALKIGKQIISLKNKKMRNHRDRPRTNFTFWGTMSNNNGAVLEIGSKKPILEIYWYSCRGKDTKQLITDEMFAKEYTCIQGSNGNTLKRAFELELETIKKTPFQLDWDDYEDDGISTDSSWLTGAGYVSNSIYGISESTSKKSIESFIFHELGGDFSITIGDKTSQLNWQDRMKAVSKVLQATKKGINVIINISES